MASWHLHFDFAVADSILLFSVTVDWVLACGRNYWLQITELLLLLLVVVVVVVVVVAVVVVAVICSSTSSSSKL